MSDPCTDASIAANAKGLGIDTCVIKGFCAQYSHLPDNPQQLDDWGNANGYRHPDGSWTCPTGVHPPSGGNTGGNTGGGNTTGGGTGTGTGITNPDPFASILASFQANPTPFLLAAGIGYLLGRK